MALRHVEQIGVARTTKPVRPLAPRRGLPQAMHRHLLASHEDQPRRMGATIAPLLGPAAFDVTDGAASVVNLHLASLRWLRLAYLDVDAPWLLRTQRPRDDVQLLLWPTDGELLVRSGNEELVLDSTAAACPHRRRPLHLEGDGQGPLLLLALDSDGLRRGIDTLLGRTFTGDLDFQLAMDLTAPGFSRWHTALGMLHVELELLSPEEPVDLAVQPLESMVLTTLLVTQQSTASEELRRQPSLLRNRVLRLAVEHIEDHLTERLTMADVALAAGVSVRAVQRTFSELLDTTPMQYARDRRLEAAREELLRRGPGGDASITEVAHGWGFSNPGRFARAYRQRFGEPPSAALRR